MNVTILLPEFDHPAIEERYAYLQLRLLLSRETPGSPIETYSAVTPAAEIVKRIGTEYVLVVTNPLIVVSPALPAELLRALASFSDARAAAPSVNDAGLPLQRHPLISAYLTLRQFQQSAESRSLEEPLAVAAEWDSSDPSLFLTTRRFLADTPTPLRFALRGQRVVVSRNAIVHKYASQRGLLRDDLLARVPHDARTILEFGCGEGALGAALKNRQVCRVVGVELDSDAAAIARRRLDEVHSADVRPLIRTLDGTFDWIVGGDILEHLDDPWTFLSDLKRVAATHSRLLLSIPNIACWPIVADLLRGRFDYVYLGILCAGHLRFFTRQTIEDMLAMAGWIAESIEPQAEFITPEYDALIRAFPRDAFSEADLKTTGYYVTARPSP